MKIDGSDWKERFAELKARNEKDNATQKKRLWELFGFFSELLEQWDKWHFKEIRKELIEFAPDLEKIINDSFKLQNPDEEIMQLTFCLRQFKEFIKENVYGAETLTEEEFVENLKNINWGGTKNDKEKVRDDRTESDEEFEKLREEFEKLREKFEKREVVGVLFPYFPKFKSEYEKLLENKIVEITQDNKLKWNCSKTSLCEYFRERFIFEKMNWQLLEVIFGYEKLREINKKAPGNSPDYMKIKEILKKSPVMGEYK